MTTNLVSCYPSSLSLLFPSPPPSISLALSLSFSPFIRRFSRFVRDLARDASRDVPSGGRFRFCAGSHAPPSIRPGVGYADITTHACSNGINEFQARPRCPALSFLRFLLGRTRTNFPRAARSEWKERDNRERGNGNRGLSFYISAARVTTSLIRPPRR